MISNKAIVLLLVAVLVAPMGIVFIGEDSDAHDSEVLEVKTKCDFKFYRFDDTMSVEDTYSIWYTEMFLTKEKCDEDFNDYINGVDEDFLKKVVDRPVNQKYWVYIFDSNRYNEHEDAKEFSRDFTVLQYKPGEHKIMLNENINNVSLGGAASNDLKYLTDVEFDTYGGSVYLERDWDSKTAGFFKPIKVTVYESGLLGEAYVPTNEVVLSSMSTWNTCDITLNTKYHSNDVYAVQKDSLQCELFIQEVVGNDLLDFDYKKYGMYKDEIPAGDWTLFSLSSYAYLYNDNGDYHDLLMNPVKELNTEGWIYSYANSDFSVAVSYDSSKYVVYLTEGSNYYGDPYILMSGYKYTFHTDYAKDYYVYLEPVVRDGAKLSAECLMDVEGVPSPSSNYYAIGVVLVLVCAAVFGLLFVAGMKPKWSEDGDGEQ